MHFECSTYTYLLKSITHISFSFVVVFLASSLIRCFVEHVPRRFYSSFLLWIIYQSIIISLLPVRHEVCNFLPVSAVALKKNNNRNNSSYFLPLYDHMPAVSIDVKPLLCRKFLSTRRVNINFGRRSGAGERWLVENKLKLNPAIVNKYLPFFTHFVKSVAEFGGWK